MGKAILILLIASVVWYVQHHYDFSNVKKNSIEALKKEKTINTVNSSRDRMQSEIYDVTTK